MSSKLIDYFLNAKWFILFELMFIDGFVFIVQVFEDISGNGFIENPCAPVKDPGTEVVRFVRNIDQDHILGIYSPSEVGVEPEITKSDPGLLKKIEAGDFTLEDLHGEVLQFPTPCPDCGINCQTNMKVTSILSDFQQELERSPYQPLSSMHHGLCMIQLSICHSMLLLEH
jgi:hypothetical protein